jgi:hypothetical protein
LPWWVGADRFKLCAACQRIEDRADAERRRRENQRASEID